MIIILQFLCSVLYSYWIMRLRGVGEAGGQGGPACAPQRDGHQARGRLPAPAGQRRRLDRTGRAPAHPRSVTWRHYTNKPTNFCR